MAMTREELEKKAQAAKSADEIKELLKAEGHEVTQEQAEALYREARVRAGGVYKLSLDELDAVTGGRDYLTDGCAATVEPGSDCWNKDGGCFLSYYQYTNKPIKVRCPKCNAWVAAQDSYYVNYGYYDNRSGFYYRYKCRNCGEFDVKQ